MKIIDVLNQEKAGISFEFFPAKTTKGLRSLEETVIKLSRYKPLYMSMTYGAGGSSQERTKDAVYMMKKQGNTIVMPHLTGIGATRAYVRS